MEPVHGTRDADAMLRTQARVAGVVLGAFFTVVGFILGILFGVRGLWLVPFALAVGVGLGWLSRRMISGISNAAGNAIGSFVVPSGTSTPYAPTYSREQSLAARGEVAAAMHAYAEAMLNNPLDPEPRFQAAELQARAGDAPRAAELFAEGRRLTPNHAPGELYATQRLVDVYLGPLAQPGRALVELRRLVDRFPNTREAAAARDAIARLKSPEG